MDSIFEQFVREKRFLNNVTEKTIEFYQHAWVAFQKHGGGLSKDGLKTFVISLREKGLKTATINCYIRGMNSFLSWLHENEHIQEQLRIKLLKEERTVIKTFTDQQIRAMVNHRPETVRDKRLHALICLLVDTGIRIAEALTLHKNDVDMHNLLIKVMGKGKKERIVPMSLECRKVLCQHMKTHPFDLVFCTRDGGRLLYRNCLRDFKALAKRLGITGVRVSFHTLRHGFALNYVRQGGSLFHLQKALGHTTLQMTRRYCELDETDLKLVHQKLSPLARLRR